MDLTTKSALVVGAGGLGGPALLVLAAGGVGRLVLVEDDVVETSNLNRQPLFGEADLGARKAAAGEVPSCSQAGILGPVAGFAGALMGAEALRLLAGERGAYEGRLYTFEARGARSRLVLVRKRPGCAACAGTQPLASSEVPVCEKTSSRAGAAP